jgi:hypothetical protein
MMYSIGPDMWCIDDRKNAVLVKCPKCEHEHLEIGTAETVSFSTPAFQDELGRWHRHDESKVVQWFTCRLCEYQFSMLAPPKP